MIPWTGDQLIHLHKIKLHGKPRLLYVHRTELKPRSQHVNINLDVSFEHFCKEKSICYTVRHFDERGRLSSVHPL
jgi:hypothetical protein